MACACALVAADVRAEASARDAESSLKKIAEVEKIKTDLKDASQIKDALERLADAIDEVPRLVRCLEEIESGTKDAKVNDQRSKTIGRTKTLAERLKKALDKLKDAKGDPKRAHDSVDSIKAAIADRKEVCRLLDDLIDTMSDALKAANEASKQAAQKAVVVEKQHAENVASAGDAARRACDAAELALDRRDRAAALWIADNRAIAVGKKHFASTDGAELKELEKSEKRSFSGALSAQQGLERALKECLGKMEALGDAVVAKGAGQ